MVKFKKALDWQTKFQEGLLNAPSSPQGVWFLQHFSCYTLGRGSNENNLLFDSTNPPADLYRIDRGGEVTFHTPGQLVVYLVLDLQRYKTDLHWYLRELEEVLIDLLTFLDLPAQRINGLTGLWCEGFKIASIGISCKRWITKHGLALNINCDLDGFQQIVPCGLHGANIANIDHWIPGIKVEDVKPLMKKFLQERFQLVWEIND